MNFDLIINFIDRDGLSVKSRKQDLIYKRYYLMFTLEKMGYSQEVIAGFFNKHRTSVYHACKVHQSLIQVNDRKYRKTIAEYAEALENVIFEVPQRDLIHDLRCVKCMDHVRKIIRRLDEGCYNYLKINN
jgi:hypothetical protein